MRPAGRAALSCSDLGRQHARTRWLHAGRVDPPGQRSCSEMGVIMLTSGARPGDVQRCEELHMAARLMKPVIQAELLDAIGLALGQSFGAGPGNGRSY